MTPSLRLRPSLGRFPVLPLDWTRLVSSLPSFPTLKAWSTRYFVVSSSFVKFRVSSLPPLPWVSSRYRITFISSSFVILLHHNDACYSLYHIIGRRASLNCEVPIEEGAVPWCRCRKHLSNSWPTRMYPHSLAYPQTYLLCIVQIQNITVAVNFLISLLKKNWQNVRVLFIKSTHSKPHRIY